MSQSFGRQAIFSACLFLSLFPLSVSAEEGEYIERFETVIGVQADGSVLVTETIRYSFGLAERHGIYRDIPVEYKTQGGVTRSMLIDRISVSDDQGKDMRHEDSRTDGYVRVKIGDPDQYVTGRVAYVIRYRVRDVIGYFDGFDELYWNATGNSWAVPIRESVAIVRFPESIAVLQSSCYIGPLGSTERCLASQDAVFSSGEFRFEAGRMLPAGSGLTIALGFPKGIVHEPAALKRFIWFFIDNPFVLLPFAMFGFMFRRWWRDGRDPVGRGTIVPEYEVPAHLSSLHIAALQDGRLSGKEIPAAIIDLAVQGYLVIERVTVDGIVFNSTDYRLRETAKHPEPGSIESALLEAIFVSAHGGADAEQARKFLASNQSRLLPGFLKRSIEASLPKADALSKTGERSAKVSELKNKFYAKIPDLEKRAVADLVKERYFTASPQEVWGKYTLWGLAVFFFSFFILPMLQLEGVNVLALLICVPVYVFFAYLMPRVTREGAIMKERLLGLKEYLQIAEKRRLEFHNAPEKTPELFEQLLPAALLLGVSDIWAKEFADLSMTPPEWYRGGNADSFSVSSFASDLSGFSQAAASSLASAPSGSGSSGGGFSGGGGGGGGGGSW